MAEFFPDEVPGEWRGDASRRAEVTIYDALHSQLSGRWAVFYSVTWVGQKWPGGPPCDGETDLLLAHPVHGILLVEVKGGQIRYEGHERQWWSRDGKGVEHRIDPFGQLAAAKHALLDMIHSQPVWTGRFIPMGQAVAFPDVVIGRADLPAEAARVMILDRDDMDRLEKRAVEVMAYWRGREPGESPYGKALVEELKRRLAPTVTLRNPLGLQFAEEDREILRLTEEQFRLLDFLGRRRRAAVSGCAGSGKTLMAVEKARRLAGEGFRTLLTCFHRPLAAHLARGTAGVENLEVLAFADLCRALALRAEIPAPPEWPGGGEALDDAYPEALLDATRASPDLRYHALIVDEGQDFHEIWWVALQECLADPRAGIFYVFYDDNQRVYGDRGPLPHGLDTYPMTENVRNTRTIHRELAAHYEGEAESLPRGPLGRDVELIPYSSAADLAHRLDILLHRLIVAERVPAHDIVVLTPRAPGGSSLKGLALGRGYRLDERPGGDPRAVLLAHVDEFKGLERPVVVVAELDTAFLNDPQRVHRCYVAFSRPRNHLVLMGPAAVLTQLTTTG